MDPFRIFEAAALEEHVPLAHANEPVPSLRDCGAMNHEAVASGACSHPSRHDRCGCSQGVGDTYQSRSRRARKTMASEPWVVACA